MHKANAMENRVECTHSFKVDTQEMAIVCFAIQVYETKSENSWKMEL